MRRFDVLQILRGIAALMVVIDHAILHVLPDDPAFVIARDVAGSLGRMGVNTFFIISGFIMVHTTRGAQKLAPFERVKDFAWKRLSRLIPLYWIASFCAMAVGLILAEPYTLTHLALSLAFLPNFLELGPDAKMPPVLGVGWTLNYEAFFYLIFALGLLFRRPIGLIFCALSIAGLIVVGPHLAAHADPMLARFILFYTFKNMLFFVAGIGIGLIADRLPSLPGTSAAILSVAIMVVTLSLRPLVGFNEGSGVWSIISLLASMAAVIVAISGGSIKGGLQGAMLHAGNASYATYLFHTLVIDLLSLVRPAVASFPTQLLLICVATVLSLAVGSLAHIWIEIPITRALRRPSETRSPIFQP